MSDDVAKAKQTVRDRQQAYWSSTAEAGKQTQQGQGSKEAQGNSATDSVRDSSPKRQSQSS